MKLAFRKNIIRGGVLVFALVYLVGLYYYLSHRVQKEKMGPRYSATLAQGIDFTKSGYPDFISNVTGLSLPEGWGRWSDAKDAGPRIILSFTKPLPENFTLELDIKGYGPNQTEPITLIVGDTKKSFTLITEENSSLKPDLKMVRLKISQNPLQTPASSIELLAPKPTTPPKPPGFNPSNPGSTDQRLLGIGLVGLRIL